MPFYGQETHKEVCIGFRVGNATLDTGYKDNARNLSDVVAFLTDIKKDRAHELVSVTFCGSASPEGSTALNRSLASRRMAALERYVRNQVDLPDSIVKRREGFIAWDRLDSLVSRSDMPHRQEVLDILRNVPEFVFTRGALTDSRKKRLMDLQYGRTWNYMLQHFFPEVRNASVILVTLRPTPQPPVEEPAPVKEEPVAVVPAEPAEPVTPAAPAEPAREKKPFYMGLKTNLLYDALAVPNVGAEFWLGDGWSVAGSWMYAWWHTTHNHFWRAYGGELAVRHWLGSGLKPLTGHHVGVYGQIFTYDFQLGGKGYMGGKPGGSLWDEMNYAAGVEYGYAMPVARRLNLDFCIGLGYWGGTYYTYKPLDGHYVWQSTRKRHWVGPTKAEVSLVWLLGRGNVNEKKGGTQ